MSPNVAIGCSAGCLPPRNIRIRSAAAGYGTLLVVENIDQERVLVWRPWLVTRAFYLLVALMMMAVLAFCAPVIAHGCSDARCVAEGGRGWALYAAVIAFVVGSICLSGVWFRLMITSDRLVTRGLWWRTQAVPLRDVIGASAGEWGMRVDHTGSGHRSGKPLTVWAVQTGNLSQWTGRRGRADRVGRQVMAAAEEARSNG